tara:strand:+ start:20 stop:403 length:384 start_codon:yes stop_codon:yes gene_type:complete
MKYLEIKDKKGYFRRGDEMLEIDQINAEDIHSLINNAHEADFEIDAYNEAELPNKAQQIIYENIHTKLADFLTDKEQFAERVDNLYAEAIGKYGADVRAEPEPEVDNANDLGPEEDEDDIKPGDSSF